VARLELAVHVLLDQVHGTCPGPSIMTWTSWSQAIFVSSPRVSSSANCASSLASAWQPGRKAVAQGEGDVVGGHKLAHLLEVRVEEALLVVGQAPLGHDGAAAGHDARHTPGGEGM